MDDHHSHHNHHDHHAMMNHSAMNHSMVNHSMVNHPVNASPSLPPTVTAALVEGIQSLSDRLFNNDTLTMDHSGHSMDHSGHMDHSSHVMDHSGHSMDAMTHSGDPMTHSGGMKMYFHFGVEETILFKGWHTSTVIGLIGSMIAIFVVALLYEGLKYFREYLFKKALTNSRYSATCGKSASSDSDKPMQFWDQVLLPAPLHILSTGHFLQTFLHMFQFIISYCLMLIFMTYNVWLCLACTFGAGLGYFLFGWKKTVVVDVTEHCH